MSNYEFKLTPAYCLYNGAAVLSQDGAEIKFLIENPKDLLLQERLKKAFCSFVKTVLELENYPESFVRKPKITFKPGSRTQLRRCVSSLYSKSIDINAMEYELNEQKEKAEAAAVVLLDSILSEAKQKMATDIHIEGQEVRLRVGNQLCKEMELQKEKADELIQRIKLLAGMNVIEHRISQDGHFVYGKESPLFVRVSTMAVIGQNYTEECESVVMRILDTTRIPLTLDALGFDDEQLAVIDGLLTLKNGLILICGPTGSGKSTTAASLLQELQEKNEGKLKIISLEDPPEYILPGVSQVTIDENGRNTFSDALAHVFRQDPDVIMIGEIRDEKTAAVALRASMTGHLVFATLHTDNAVNAVLRMENLGAHRDILKSVLRAVFVQELCYGNNSEKLASANLLADVAVLDWKDESIITEEDFVHYVNGAELLSKSVELMKKRIFPVFGSYESKVGVKNGNLGINGLNKKRDVV